MQEEESLVRRAQKQDQEALAEIYERYFDKIYRYIFFRVGNIQEAEDMTQQVFLKALEKIASFKWRSIPLSAWLFRIAHNKVVDYFRKKSKWATMPIEPYLAIVEDGDDPHLLLEEKLETEQLISAIRGLTEAQRAVISLRFSSELSVAEAAKVLGKNPGAVKALQHNAIVALRKKLITA